MSRASKASIRRSAVGKSTTGELRASGHALLDRLESRMSAKGLNAIKAFKGIKAAKTPAKLKGKKATAIQRAVRGFYLG